MRTELPGERLRRRLIGQVEAATDDEFGEDDDGDGGGNASHDTDTDPNSLLPRWLPDTTAGDGWLAKVRADPGRAGAVVLAVVAAVAVLVTVFTVVRDRPAPVVSAKLPPVEMVSSAEPVAHPVPDVRPGGSGPNGPDQPVVVSVVGLVKSPGLATLPPGARVADALTAAGGTLNGADTIGLNMARQLADGEQIVVGIAPPSGEPTVLGSSVTAGSAGGAARDAPTSPPTTSRSPKPASAQPINLNTATAEQLDMLPGVGPVTAAAIVAWRDSHGKFRSVDQLGDVEGIGPVRLEKLRAQVCV